MEYRSEIARACQDWWLVDAELDALTAKYSLVETELIQKFGTLEAAHCDAGSADLLRSIEQGFRSLDSRRERCRWAVAHLPVRTVEEAADKLAIAARLLNDEGGFEAIVVEEAARFLANLNPDAPRRQSKKHGRKAVGRGLANAFYRNALGFADAAVEMRSINPSASEHFLAIAVELALKSYLLHLGVTDEWNQRHLRHDLTKALRFARLGGLNAHSEKLRTIAHRLGPHYQAGGFARSSEALILAEDWKLATESVTELMRTVGEAFGGSAGDHVRTRPAR